MSKKTIYQHFKDKTTLVEAVVDAMFLLQDEQIKNIHDKRHDAIEEMYLIAVFIRQTLSSMDASVIFDLKKYYPTAFERFQFHKEDKMQSCFFENLKEGINQGFYRKEINIEILSKLKMIEAEWSFDPEMFAPEKYKIVDVQMELFDHFLYGVLTPEGFKMLNVYKDKYKQ
jgi:AcrR family transcriptional regulator